MIFNIWKFENRQPNERVILLIRKHPIVMLKASFQIIAIALIILAVIIFFGFNFNTFLVLILGVVVAIIIVASNLYRWYNDLYLVTDRRLINVDQNSIFSRSVDETALDLIQDVTYEVKGLIPTMLNIGRVAIQTAGSVQDIHIDFAPNPAAIQLNITRAFHEYRARMGFSVEAEDNKTSGGSNEQNFR